MKDDKPDWWDRAAAIFSWMFSWTFIALIFAALVFSSIIASDALTSALPEMDPLWDSTRLTNLLLAGILLVLWIKR